MLKRLFLLVWLPLSLHSATLKEKLLSAKTGDFVVTEQNKVYSILVVRDVSTSSIKLEEISVPLGSVDLKKIAWREWLNKQAPGNTSWMLYEIDFIEDSLANSFSFADEHWVTLDGADYLLAKLLTLSLSELPIAERRKIGPPPESEPDLRPLWKPPLFINGKKVKSPDYTVMRGIWPKDETLLSECVIDLYFDGSQQKFPFPYFIEISNGHYTFKMKVIDSGSELSSPIAHIHPEKVIPLNSKELRAVR